METVGGMKILTSWKWGKMIIPEEERRKRRNVSKVTGLECINPSAFNGRSRADVVLVTGDGSTLPEDVKLFESWEIPHDIYCCNRSLLYFQREIDHWGAVDAEESAWLSQYYKTENGKFLRHVIGVCKNGYDVYWNPVGGFETEFGRRLWIGNSGYFGMLCCVEMGYKKIILAGMPLDRKRHWYEPEGQEGPTWQADTYTIWMDYKMDVPESSRVRSMSGYSKFIMGEANKDWLTLL